MCFGSDLTLVKLFIMRLFEPLGVRSLMQYAPGRALLRHVGPSSVWSVAMVPEKCSLGSHDLGMMLHITQCSTY